MKITEIEKMDEKEVAEIATLKENRKIKGYSVYYVRLNEDETVSAIVFKNGKQITYSNLYSLTRVYPHPKTDEEAVKAMRKKLRHSLYTEDKLMKATSYVDYKKKVNFLSSHWIQQFDYLSWFFIGSDEERKERQEQQKKEYPYSCMACFCYVKDKNVADKANRIMESLESSYKELEKDDDVFRKMIAVELANHEAGYTEEYEEALDALGIDFDKLSDARKDIVKEKLRKQIEYNYSFSF